MKYILIKMLLSVIILFSCHLVSAQVGVMTTSPYATLHVESKPADVNVIDGIMSPQLTRAQLISKDSRYGADQTDAIVYVTTINGTVSTKTAKVDRAGYYYFDGSVWQNMGKPGKYFYLPVFELPSNVKGTNKTFDLYTQVLSKQFNQVGNTQYFTSNGVMVQLPAGRLTASAFDYVITHYDTDVIKVNSISATGIVNYDVLSTLLGPSSFLNVVVITK